MSEINFDLSDLDGAHVSLNPQPRMSVLRRIFFEDMEMSSKAKRGSTDSSLSDEPIFPYKIKEYSPLASSRSLFEESTPIQNSSSNELRQELEDSTPRDCPYADDIQNISISQLPSASCVSQIRDSLSSRCRYTFCERLNSVIPILTNVMAGSLCGLAFKHIFKPIANALMTGLVVTQILSFMGYAKVSWYAFFRDTYLFFFRGPSIKFKLPVNNRFLFPLERLMFTLSQSFYRRASFWVSFAVGLLLL